MRYRPKYVLKKQDVDFKRGILSRLVVKSKEKRLLLVFVG